MPLMRTLFSAKPSDLAVRDVLPKRLLEEYDGDLSFPSAAGQERPYVFANFVTTLDGIVSFDIPGQAGGAEISGRNSGDRFLMGLLRASADAVMVGAGTLAAVGKSGLWTPGFIYPPAAPFYAEYRQSLGKNGQPLVVVVSGSGEIDLHRDLFETNDVRVLILTTEQGSVRLVESGVGQFASTTVRVLKSQYKPLAPSAILSLLKNEFGVKLALHEGGPTFLSSFLREELVDDLFLTLAPQIAGNKRDHPRPGLVSDLEFMPGNAPWLTLLSVKQSESYLYLHYRRKVG